MSKVFYRKQFSDYLGENRSILDVVIGFVPDVIPPTPSPTGTSPVTPTQTPTPTRTPQPTPITGLTSQVEIFSTDGNITITGTTWEIEFDGLSYSGSTGDTRNEVKICVEFQSFPEKGASYLYKINFPSGFTYDDNTPFDEFILDVGDFQGLILGNYRWNGTITRYLNSVQIGSPLSSIILYDPTPTSDGGCVLDILTPLDFFLVDPIPTSTPTPTPSVTPIVVTPTVTSTSTSTPTATSTATIPVTPTNTSTPTPTSGFYTYSVKSGTTACDACFASTFYNVYGPLANGPTLNVGDYVYLDSALTIPHPDSYVVESTTTARWAQIFSGPGGAPGLIGSADPNGCIDGQCPSPTPTPTQSVTPTNTTTPTPTPTPSEAAYDADAAVYLGQVLFAGGTLDATISGATNTLFTSLKSAGIYSKIDAMYPFLGGVANSTAINAIDTGTYFIQWNGGMVHNVSGVTGNGTNAYGNSQYSNQNFSGDSLHVVCAQNLASTTGADHNYGTTGVDPRVQFSPDNAGNIQWRGGPNIQNSISNSGVTTGISIMNRSGTTTTDLYLDATLIDSITGSYGSGADRSMYVLALNVGNAPFSGTYSNGRLSFLSFGKGLSSSEVTDFNNIVDTFNNTLNRNP